MAKNKGNEKFDIKKEIIRFAKFQIQMNKRTQDIVKRMKF